MTTDNTINNDTNTTEKTPPKPDNCNFELGYISIDEPVLDWRFKFHFVMLRLARIVTAKEEEIRDFSAARVNKLMEKHSKEIGGYYTTKEIKEKLWNCKEDIRGGGYKVEWFETSQPHRRSYPPHFSISFTHLYYPNEMVVKTEPPHELVRS